MLKKLEYWVENFDKLRDHIDDEKLTSFDALVSDIEDWVDIYQNASVLEKNHEITITYNDDDDLLN